MKDQEFNFFPYFPIAIHPMKRIDFIKTGLLGLGGLVLQPLLGKAAPVSTKHVQYYTAVNPGYDALRRGFNLRIQKHPLVIAICADTKGVQEAVNYARILRLPVSVKSGGHCMEGLSCGEQSMQIIVTGMKQINWINDHTITCGPGVLLYELYDALLPKKKILPGGSCQGVGIGGLTLGGGYGLMSRKFGLTCDHLIAIEMVDGEGKIRNSSSDPELLWACRGGGNGNFGIITKMTFNVRPAPSMMSSYRFRTKKPSIEKAHEQLAQWFEATTKLPNSCFSTILFNGQHTYVLLTNVDKENEAVRSFVSHMKTMHETSTANKHVPLQKALKTYYGQALPIHFKNASAGLYRSFADIEPIIDDILQIVFTTRGMMYQINTLGGAIRDAQLEKASCFPHRSFPYFSELQSYWDEGNSGERLMARFADIQQLIATQGLDAHYRNYPDLQFHHAREKYYGDSLVRLQQIKLRYDPQNVIRHEQSIQLPSK